MKGPCTPPPSAAGTAVHPVDEKLPPSRLVPAALQHIAAMYAGVVTPPLIIGQAVGLDAAGMTRLIAASLLIAGLATLLQTLGAGRFAGNRLPFVNAASSAGIAPMLAIAETSAPGHQLPAIYGAVLVAGVFCLAVGPFFGRLLRFFPPLVTGVVITLIGVTLMPVPVGWAQGGDSRRRRLRRHEVPGPGRLHPRRHPAHPALRTRLRQADRPARGHGRRHRGRRPVRARRLLRPRLGTRRRAAHALRLRATRVPARRDPLPLHRDARPDDGVVRGHAGPRRDLRPAHRRPHPHPRPAHRRRRHPPRPGLRGLPDQRLRTERRRRLPDAGTQPVRGRRRGRRPDRPGRLPRPGRGRLARPDARPRRRRRSSCSARSR